MRGASLGAARAPVRPSRRPPGLSPARAPQDEVNLWGHEEKPHAEEAAKPPSRSTQAGQLWYGPRLWPHLPVFAAIAPPRSDERRVGQECVSRVSTRWSAYHYKKKNTINNNNK